ncbi:MAG: hypothetical protein ORN83_07680 [Chthoniobacteraceae bacterium]|nr:hypothetical protein [Chthoniobacteraceae bacterium]
MMQHIYNTKKHADVSQADKAAAYTAAGIEGGYIKLLTLGQ